jgi:hypothetical protein
LGRMAELPHAPMQNTLMWSAVKPLVFRTVVR